MSVSGCRREGLGRLVPLVLLLSGCDALERIGPDLVPGRLRSGRVVRQLRSDSDADRRRALRDLRHIGWYHLADSPSRSDEQVKLAVETLRGDRVRSPAG